MSKTSCLDCGKLLKWGSLRCRPCHIKWNRGENHYLWLGKNKKCTDCGKEIKWGGVRCFKCNYKYKSGVNNSLWRGGKPKCIICGHSVDNYGAKRCSNCFKSSLDIWNDKQIEILKDEYVYNTADYVANKLNKTTYSVRKKASELGIKANKIMHYNGNWEFLKGNVYEQNLTQSEIAYIAGIYDGEGHLCVNKQGYWSLGVTNTFKPLIDLLEIKFPYCNITHSKKKNPKHKDIYQWSLEGDLKVYFFLLAILPYLTVKKDKAINAIEIIKNKQKVILDVIQRRVNKINEPSCPE